ncbi:hypothetical protein NDU88_006362 [Pleurodeles waltl]|uniref:Uncharacterized protein n=1 Tax=Pleurodeles waltl TaxID=8319 RepID=A0AAV7VLS7_PLEWA|nr:hypothetical protein NDU88_006362 [Pleurodeles waltl]
MAAPSELAALDIGEAGNGQLEEGQRFLAGQVREEVIIIDSEEEGELGEVFGEGCSGSSRQLLEGPYCEEKPLQDGVKCHQAEQATDNAEDLLFSVCAQPCPGQRPSPFET